MKYDISICIITYNRGKRALENVEYLLNKIKNDNWSILVLDNGSDMEVEEYNKINKLSEENEQLIYIKHDHNLQVHGNFRACFDYAKSKYIKIMSDEDFVNVEELELLFKELEENNIGACRPSIAPYHDLQKAGNSVTFSNNLYKKGEEALYNFSFMGNYISGIIYNLEAIKTTNILDVLDENIISHKAYPHLYLDLLVAAKFDIMVSSRATVWERQAEETLIENGTTTTAKKHVGLYGYGERVNQFLNFRDDIVDAISLVSDRDDGEKIKIFINMYVALANKYFFLVFQVNIRNYVDNFMEQSLLKESFFYLVCSSCITHPYAGSEQTKSYLIDKITEIYQQYKN